MPEVTLILSDVHGDMDRVRRICSIYKQMEVLQLGDFGVGWIGHDDMLNLPQNLKFFVGNHDNRSLAYKYRSCLGPYGEHRGLFYVSGADSYDKAMRIMGISWWPDEELTYAQSMRCLEAWKTSKARVLVSHDGPHSIVNHHFGISAKSGTRNLLQAMIEARPPTIHIFGHHHRPLHVCHGTTLFKCLPIGGAIAVSSNGYFV